MGFLKKIFKPVSKVLDKIVPNEIKPALPYLSAFAPMMLGGGIMGTSMLQRGLMSGGLNLASQLAQEGNEGDVNMLSALMSGGIGALSAPGASEKIDIMRGVHPSQEFDLALKSPPKFIDKGLEYLGKGAEYLDPNKAGSLTDIIRKGGVEPGLNMETAAALGIPLTQGTMDTAYNQAKLAERDWERDQEGGGGGDGEPDRGRAVRMAMEQAGHDEQTIVEMLASLGYSDPGPLGLKEGGSVKPKRGLVNESGGYAGITDILNDYIIAEPYKGEEGYIEEDINIEDLPIIREPAEYDEDREIPFQLLDFTEGKTQPFSKYADPDNRGFKKGGRVGFAFGGIDSAVEKVEDVEMKENIKFAQNMDVPMEDLVEEFIIIHKRKPNSLDELKRFYRDKYEYRGPADVKMQETITERMTAKDGGRIGFKDGTDENLVGIETLKLGDYDLEGFQNKGRGNTLMFGSDDLKMLSQALDYGELSDLSARQKEKIKESILLARAGIINPTELMNEIGMLRLEPDAAAFLKKITPDETMEKIFFDKEGDARIGVQKARKLMEDVALGGQKDPTLSSGMYNKLGDEYIQDQKKDIQKQIDFNKKYGEANFLNFKDGGVTSVLPRGKEMDYRGGGMIPMGSRERADDVPARLSKNEFVMTADAVRAAGGGSVNEGARRMYNLMNNLEARA